MPEADTNPDDHVPTDGVEEARLDALADVEIAAGKGVPHSRVREWLMKLARGERDAP